MLRYDIPELYRRKGDIPLLMEYFRKHYNKKVHKQIMAYSSEVQDIFLAYNWPGNVRELKNVIESAFHNNHTAILTRNDIPNYILSRLAVDTMHAEDVRGLPLHEMLARYEVLLIEDAYRRNGGSLTKTAAELQVSKQNLAYKMKKYNIRGKTCAVEGRRTLSGHSSRKDTGCPSSLWLPIAFAVPAISGM